MPTEAFTDSLRFVLRWEGGFVDHPADPGGRTNKGITQKVYDRWRKRRELPLRDVKKITDSEVRAIYEANYWLAARCDLLERDLDLVHFDTAVNMGVGRAVRILQACLDVEVDGVFGKKTKKAAENCDVPETMEAYCDAREDFYHRLAEANTKLAVFLEGWLNRVTALRREVGLPMVEAATASRRRQYTPKVPAGRKIDGLL